MVGLFAFRGACARLLVRLFVPRVPVFLSVLRGFCRGLCVGYLPAGVLRSRACPAACLSGRLSFLWRCLWSVAPFLFLSVVLGFQACFRLARFVVPVSPFLFVFWASSLVVLSVLPWLSLSLSLFLSLPALTAPPLVPSGLGRIKY